MLGLFGGGGVSKKSGGSSRSKGLFD